MSKQQQAYDDMVAKGVKPRLAEMLALRQPPGCVTDDTYLVGCKNGSEIAKSPQLAQLIIKNGGDINGRYISQLARFPGDPRAVVKSRGDVMKILDENNWGSEGTVKRSIIQGTREPAQEPEIDEKMIDRELADAMHFNPGIAETPKERADLREKIRKTYEKPKRKTKHAGKSLKQKLVDEGLAI